VSGDGDGDGVAAEWAVATAGEDGVVGSTSTFRQPDLEDVADLGG
jgi:hypothetical protein